MATKEVAVTSNGGYLAPYENNASELHDVITENFGAGGIVARELPRIRIPAGGGKAWEIPTLEGSDFVPEFKGVIAHWKTMRAYWPMPIEESGGAPPDCASDDGVIGIGDPGIACAKCPFNVFGSADGGNKKGKACREVRAMFVLDENSHLPYFMPLPTMSIAPAKQFFTKLTQAGLPFWKVEVSFTLEQTKNSTGTQYSRAVLNLSRKLTDAEAGRVQVLREALKPAIDGQELTREDVGE